MEMFTCPPVDFTTGYFVALIAACVIGVLLGRIISDKLFGKAEG